MMVKASPAATFEMVDPHFLLELFVVALDAPAEFREPDELIAWHVGGKSGQPALGRA